MLYSVFGHFPQFERAIATFILGKANKSDKNHLAENDPEPHHVTVTFYLSFSFMFYSTHTNVTELPTNRTGPNPTNTITLNMSDGLGGVISTSDHIPENSK